jgi:hypothetical protein
MKLIKTLGTVVLLFVALAPPAFASDISISIESLTNADIRTYTGGANYPVAPTSISVATIPFGLVTDQGAANTLGVIQTPGGSSTFTINTSVVDPTTIYTLMNSAFGASGANIGSIEFKGSGGSDALFQIVEGNNIRDHFNDGFNNVASNIVPNAFLSGSQNSSGPDRLDMQTFVLPASFSSDTLTQIIFSGSNAGNPQGEAFLAAVTASTAQNVPVPEPASATLVGIGIIGLMCCVVLTNSAESRIANTGPEAGPHQGHSDTTASDNEDIAP